MARKNGPTILQEELYPPPGTASREELEDARLLDLEAEQESPFLRGQKRVSVRRGTLPKKTAQRLIWAAIGCTLLLILGAGAAALYRYGEHSWRFRIESSDNIEISGLQNVARSQIMEVMGGDIGRNIFFVPLADRKAHLEQIPWVESASIMRFAPNRLRVEIHERTPIAFARIGPRINLIDASGVLMDLPSASKRKYSFPVIVGMNPGEPLSTRGPRMRIYNDLVRELDSDGARHSQDLSEVDLSDPGDVKVAIADPSGEVLVHLGSSNFLERYKIYFTHVQEWRQQFEKLESVDLRYDRQIIVNPDLRGAARQPALSPAAAKAAMSAGVKRAALVNYEKFAARPLPQAAAKVSVKGEHPVAAQAEPVAKVVARHAASAKVSSPKHTTKSHAVAAKTAAKKNASKKVRAKGAGKKPQARSVAKAPANKLEVVSTASPAARAKPIPSQITSGGSKKKPSPAIVKDQDHP
jgi:cell division protein FtsQ